MAMFTAPPVPPQPPAVVRCTTADGQVVSDCAKYVYKHQQNSVEARFTGSVRIDLNAAEVVIVPAGGTATIEEQAGKQVRRFSVENGKTTYTVDGVEKTRDASTRKWLRELLGNMPARPVPPGQPSR